MRCRYPGFCAPLGALLFATALAACGSVGSGNGHGALSEVALGRRIYRHGVGTDGKPIQAFSQHDIAMVGGQAACINCHRPSGLGSNEGGYYVPPINAPLLYAPRKLDRLRLFPSLYHQIQPQRFKHRLYQPRMRPAYTRDSLGKTLRTGIDPGGNTLAAIMPRYQISAADVAALDAYLHTLSAHIDPGVTATEIRLATVFSDNVPASQREAMLSLMREYVSYYNLNRREDLARGRFSPYNRSEFVPIQRAWTLSVWELKGDASTWRAQLENYYRKDKVFALIGGKVRGSWTGPAAFCNAHHLPYLFPDTELPAWPPKPYGYTVYFDAGLALEAQVTANFLADGVAGSDSVMQLAAADDYGRLPARVFQQTLGKLEPRVKVQQLTFHGRTDLEHDLRSLHGNFNRILVVWPGEDVAGAIAALAAVRPDAALIFLPSRAIDAVKKQAFSADFASAFRFADPYELDPSSHVKSYETRAWMLTRRLDLSHPTLMFEEYYAMSLLQAAVFEISNDYYRDYLLERVEDESQKDLNPGVFPKLALGPGERFAAKGAYIVRLDPDRKPSGLSRVSDWITPTS
ncbi:MAG: ABC transporter substrate-binding protein [Gammaproteobacteria bacterium]|nr:ABC transporter substrate-binding protein [Gammaproteobacteria bacterium]